jgi:hypothetical protein
MLCVLFQGLLVGARHEMHVGSVPCTSDSYSPASLPPHSPLEGIKIGI